MQKSINSIIKHPLISGSAIVFIGALAANIGNYIFNLLMGRMLPVSEYGLLLSLISVMGLLSVFQTALANIFAKFAAQFSAAGDKHSLNALKITGIKMAVIISILFIVVLSALTNIIDSFLHLSSYLLWIFTALSIGFSILASFTIGILQGQLKFVFIAILNIIGVVAKILIGVGLVFYGFGVVGGIFGFLGFFLIPFIIAFPFVIPLKNESKKINENVFFQEFKKYSLPFLTATIGITFIQSGDVILARHFFSPTASGQFAALSLMGKAIFYFTTPIYFVFFPLIAHKREKKEKLLGTLVLASVIVIGCSALFSFVYFAYPALIVHIFFPAKEYAVTVPYLGLFSLYIMVFSLAFLLNNFFLSSGKTGVWKINISVCVLFILLFSLFHTNFFQVIIVLFATSFLLLLSLCIYYKTNGSD